MNDDTPTRCQFPDCIQPAALLVTWWDIVPRRERRCCVCAAHLAHVGILAPVRQTVAIGEKEEEES